MQTRVIDLPKLRETISTVETHIREVKQQVPHTRSLLKRKKALRRLATTLYEVLWRHKDKSSIRELRTVDPKLYNLVVTWFTVGSVSKSIPYGIRRRKYLLWSQGTKDSERQPDRLLEHLGLL